MTDYIFGEIKLSLPDSWHEVTLNQFLNIREYPDKGDSCALLSILSGVSYSDIFNQETTAEQELAVAKAIEFLRVAPDKDSFKLPEKYSVQGKSYDIPKDIALRTYGQKMVFQTLVLPFATMDGEKAVCSVEVFDKAIAIYLMPIITGEKFDGDKIDSITTMIRTTSLADCYALATFFLNRSLGLSTSKVKPSQETPLQATKSKRAFKPSKSTVR